MLNSCCAQPHSRVPASSPARSLHAGKSAFFRGLLSVFALALIGCFTTPTSAQTQTIVQKHGQLRVSGNRIVDKNGQAVQLRGMSMYWSQWYPKYWNAATVKWLKDDWKITVIRAAMAVEPDGYLVNPTTEKNKVIAVVDAAIANGIYVIIDWHDHNADQHRSQAQAFFSEMAQRYGNTPNVLYETWNEPLEQSWANVIKPYHQAVVSSIRRYDPDNIIICGTRSWSQHVEEPKANPVPGTNIAYTLHFYATTHRDWLRARALDAMTTTGSTPGIALFVTEYGTTEASGKGAVDPTETQKWWAFLDQHKIGHCNWSVADIPESSAALVAGASANGGWPVSQLKQSGQLVRTELRAKAPDLSIPSTGPAAGTYSLRNRATGRMLDNLGSTADNTNVGQWSDGTSTNQRWVLSYVGGYAKLQCVTGGKYLDSLGRTGPDTAVGQWANSSSYNQQWTIQSLGGGYYKIVNRANGLCLDSGGWTANTDVTNRLGYVEFWGSGSSYNQQWQFVAP
jgi:endoglucanase